MQHSNEEMLMHFKECLQYIDEPLRCFNCGCNDWKRIYFIHDLLYIDETVSGPPGPSICNNCGYVFMPARINSTEKSIMYSLSEGPLEDLKTEQDVESYYWWGETNSYLLTRKKYIENQLKYYRAHPQANAESIITEMAFIASFDKHSDYECGVTCCEGSRWARYYNKELICCEVCDPTFMIKEPE